MNLETRVTTLEHQMKELQEKLAIYVKQEELDDRDWQRNRVDDYMIKLVYPGIYTMINHPTAGFPKNRKKVAEQLVQGQFMFVYVTSPVKKIIGLTKIVTSMKSTTGRWPYSVDLEWVIAPRMGVSFQEVGLDIRPRPGDTLYSISEEKAEELIEALNKQYPLGPEAIAYLAEMYEE